jgi:hypothetical protein
MRARKRRVTRGRTASSPEAVVEDQNVAGMCISLPKPLPIEVKVSKTDQTGCSTPFTVRSDLVKSEITGIKLQMPPKQNPALGGRLRLFMHNWQKITKDQAILQVVKGYQIPWLTKPIQPVAPPQIRVSETETIEISSQVQTMFQNEVIREVDPEPEQFLSQLFLRKKKDGSFRPVFNLKKLNAFIPYVHFKMETFQMLPQMIQPGDWMVKIDLKDAYFCVPIAEQCQKYLRFQWLGKTYQFQAMAFGLGPGPLIFTKIMKVPMGILRRLGFRMMIYLDDIILFHQNKEELVEQMHTTVWVLQCLGFIINQKKSALSPSQQAEYLGFLVETMTVQLPQEKVQKIKMSCAELLSAEKTTVRQLAQLIGTLTSTAAAIMPGPLHYRHLQMQKRAGLKANRQSYNASVRLSAEMKQDLEWWINQLECHNGKKIISPNPDEVIETDASKTGWGAVSEDRTVQGEWTTEEKELHINVLELKVPRLALTTLGHDWKNCHIHFKMDNRTAVANLNKMGNTKSKDLLSATQQLWALCLERGITITAEYLPGLENSKADRASRVMIQDASDWMLDRATFKSVEKALGPVTTDLFASWTNAQKKQYVSWKPDPGAIRCDAFSMKWHEGMYAFPPFCLINRCLAKVQKEQTELIIITPIWQAQPWYAILLAMSTATPILLPPLPNLLTNSKGERHPLIENETLQLAAWKISGKNWKQADFQRELHTSSATGGEKAQNLLTSRPGRSGIAGVVNGKLIPFRPPWQT